MAKKTEKKAARVESKKTVGHQSPVVNALVKDIIAANTPPQLTHAEKKAALKVKAEPKADVNKKNRDLVVGALSTCAMEKKSAYLKFEGNEKRRVYVAIKGPMVTLAGFELRHAGVEAVSENEAKKRHLGSVRGILYLDRQSEKVVKEVAGLLAHALKG